LIDLLYFHTSQHGPLNHGLATAFLGYIITLNVREIYEFTLTKCVLQS